MVYLPISKTKFNSILYFTDNRQQQREEIKSQIISVIEHISKVKIRFD